MFAQQQPVLGLAALTRLYACYSSMRIGGSVLALRKDGWLQLLTDARVLVPGARCVCVCVWGGGGLQDANARGSEVPVFSQPHHVPRVLS
jgi:hypothetical protein